MVVQLVQKFLAKAKSRRNLNLTIIFIIITAATKEAVDQAGGDASHLEGLAVLALPSALPEERLLLVLLLLLLQRPDVLLETNERVLLVHVCIEDDSVARD